MTMPTPWMAYYPDRFTKQTDQLRPIEHSAYYRFFESYAQTGYLLDDEYMLRDIAKLDSELTVIKAMTGIQPDHSDWIAFTDSTVKSLLARFFTLGADGAYHHEGWDKELAKARASYDAKVKGAWTVNSRRAAERAAKQHTTYNEQRTTIQPTADSSQQTSDSASEEPAANSGQPATHNPQQTPETDTVTAATGGSSGVAGLSRQTTGQRVREGTAMGTARERHRTAATGAAQVTDAVFQTKQAEKDRKLAEDREQRPWLYMTSEEYEEMRRQEAGEAAA